MKKMGYVYILSSGFKRLYIGVTNDLGRRVWEHKNPTDMDSFTARYGINQLVYYEEFDLVTAAIAREKELKGWTRIKKVALIVSINPTWKDLSLEWGKPVGPWREEWEARVPEEFKRFSPKVAK